MLSIVQYIPALLVLCFRNIMKGWIGKKLAKNNFWKHSYQNQCGAYWATYEIHNAEYDVKGVIKLFIYYIYINL